MIAEQCLTHIRECLLQALSPTHLEVIDEGYQHVGHAGSKNGGHFAVRISSHHFENKKTLECHRMIYQALGSLMEREIHALRIEILPHKIQAI